MSTSPTLLTVPTPPMTRRVRAYFAPVNRASGTPTLFDPSQAGNFDLDLPPAPWVDLGWIENFARKSGSTTQALMTGSPSSPQSQVRETLDATVSFRFMSWSKLSMALGAGAQHMNVFAPAAPINGSASGGRGIAAVSLVPGSTASFLAMSGSDAASFPAGCMVGVDMDYTGQTGFVGSGVSGAYVSNPASVRHDADYIRRITFNVARVSQVTSSGLQLAGALIAGVPGAAMRVQPVVGFVDREGGTFFHEWSALFAMVGEQGEQMFFHYPRLQAITGPQEQAVAVAAPLERIALNASFRALPVTDSNDGEQVLCFRSFLPASTSVV